MATLLTEPDVLGKETANSRHPHVSQMGSSPKSLRAMTRQEGRDIPVTNPQLHGPEKSSLCRVKKMLSKELNRNNGKK